MIITTTTYVLRDDNGRTVLTIDAPDTFQNHAKVKQGQLDLDYGATTEVVVADVRAFLTATE